MTFRLMRLEDGTLWPDPAEVHLALWRVKHGEPTKADHAHVEAAAGAYLTLVNRPAFRAKLPMIRRAVAARRSEEE